MLFLFIADSVLRVVNWINKLCRCLFKKLLKQGKLEIATKGNGPAGSVLFKGAAGDVR